MARKGLTDKQKETVAKNLAKGKETRFKSGKQAVEAGRKGGKKSQANAKAQRTLQEHIKLTLEQSAPDAMKNQMQKTLGVECESMSEIVGASIVLNALKGNNKCIELLNNATGANTLEDDKKRAEITKLTLENEKTQFELDTLKQKQAEVMEELARSWCVPITDITTDFVEMYRDLHNAFSGKNNIHEMVIKGGRGSIKSSIWASIAEETIYQDPQAHVVYTRRYKTDLRGSVYNQFMKTVIRHGRMNEWEFKVQPMCAIYKPTKQTVMFVGADKPISLKSFSVTFGYVKLLIHEECDEMAGLEQMDNIEDTFLRSDTPAVDVKIFNPPKSINNFMNAYVSDECPKKPKTRVYHSYYYNVPIEWLGERFFERAEMFKQLRPMYYRNNYLGEVTGTGGAIFDNIEEREMTDEDINRLPFFVNGLDFGFEHPQVYERAYYDVEENTLYCVEEVVARRCKNATFAKKIKHRITDEIICDSARPDSISELQSWGFNALGAKKRWGGGKGREYCWEWLQTCNKIIIDPKRCPELAREFRTLEHEQLKDGSFSSAYPTVGEDAVMALIYGLNRQIMQGRPNDLNYNQFDTEAEDFDDDE